jgi:hypothetical protein
VAGRQDQAHIAFERSGGFTGISVHTDVDTAELSEAEAAEYRSMDKLTKRATRRQG